LKSNAGGKMKIQRTLRTWIGHTGYNGLMKTVDVNTKIAAVMVVKVVENLVAPYSGIGTFSDMKKVAVMVVNAAVRIVADIVAIVDDMAVVGDVYDIVMIVFDDKDIEAAGRVAVGGVVGEVLKNIKIKSTFGI
jgi:hypothetical protein